MSYNPYRVCAGCPSAGTSECAGCERERRASEYGDEMTERGDAERKER